MIQSSRTLWSAAEMMREGAMIPTQSEIEIPLLETLQQLGGQARTKDVYPLITSKFSQLTPEDLTVKLKHGERKWFNRVQWTRQSLITSGDMVSPQRGVWAITEKGRKRLEVEGGNSASKERVA